MTSSSPRWRWRLVQVVVATMSLVVPMAAAQQTEYLTLSANEWPPYFVDDSGFAREILEICVAEAGYETRFHDITIEQTYDALRNGILDVHVFSYREGRDQFVAYGEEPIFSDGYHPVVRAGEGVEIDEISDFDALTLGHLEGLRYSPEFLDYVQGRRAAGEISVAQSNEELLGQLLARRIDVFVNLASTIQWLARQRGVEEGIEVLGYDVKSSDYYVVISRTSTRVGDATAFLGAIDECLRETKADGRYDVVRKRYGLGGVSDREEAE